MPMIQKKVGHKAVYNEDLRHHGTSASGVGKVMRIWVRAGAGPKISIQALEITNSLIKSFHEQRGSEAERDELKPHIIRGSALSGKTDHLAREMKQITVGIPIMYLSRANGSIRKVFL